MTKEEMTVHQALCELKTLDSRIQAAMGRVFVFANKHSNKNIKGTPLDEYINQVKANYQQVVDLMKRREAIKRAVVVSNATTNVTIGTQTMSVAEAIDMKQTGIGYYRDLYSVLDGQFKRASNDCASNNENSLEQRADNYMASLYGNTDMKNATQEALKVRKEFIEAQTYELVDPLKITERIEELRSKYDNFVVNIDSALSVSNALTKIIVEY